MLGMVSIAAAQDKEWPKVDVSVMDRVVYPSNVAWRNYMPEDQRNANAKIKLEYSRPLKKERDIFGGLVPYGSEWRLGANEASIITFYQTVGVGDAVLPAGAYTLSALVNEKDWTVNFSTEMGIWGSDKRDQSKTVASYKAPVKMMEGSTEALAMTFREIDENTVHLVIEWDDRRAAVPIIFNPVVFSPLDKSPMDMAHYPRKSAFINYMEGDDKNITPKIQVVYSRPMMKGRKIFGELVPYGKDWRLGANEATEIVIYEDANIGGTDIARGRYALAVTPHEDKWDITFHKDFPIWGVHKRDKSKEVATVSVPVTKDSESLEAFSVMFTEGDDGTVFMHFGWDTTRCAVPIKY